MRSTPPPLPRRLTRRARKMGTRAGGGRAAGSTSAKTPSRARRKPARASRIEWPSAKNIRSELPGGVDRDDPAGQPLIARALQSGGRDHAAEAVGMRKAADGFDEVAVGIAIAGHDFADGRNRRERIGLIDAVKQRHIDIGKFETQKTAAVFQNAF